MALVSSPCRILKFPQTQQQFFTIFRHLAYPSESSDINVVRKDRRGELFYYMHQQVTARFNIERFCNNLPRSVPFTNFREPITEGYFPKLDTVMASRAFPGRNYPCKLSKDLTFCRIKITARPSNFTLREIHRKADEVELDLSTIESWRDRILEAARNHEYVEKVDETTTRKVPLDEVTGIDILGNIVEACAMLSVNYEYYGELLMSTVYDF